MAVKCIAVTLAVTFGLLALSWVTPGGLSEVHHYLGVVAKSLV